MEKPTICIGENKGADQLRSYCEADQRLCFRYTDSTIHLLSESKISSLWPASVMTVQAGLCRTWLEPKLLVFLCTGLIVLKVARFQGQTYLVFMALKCGFWLTILFFASQSTIFQPCEDCESHHFLGINQSYGELMTVSLKDTNLALLGFKPRIYPFRVGCLNHKAKHSHSLKFI